MHMKYTFYLPENNIQQFVFQVTIPPVLGFRLC